MQVVILEPLVWKPYDELLSTLAFDFDSRSYPKVDSKVGVSVPGCQLAFKDLGAGAGEGGADGEGAREATVEWIPPSWTVVEGTLRRAVTALQRFAESVRPAAKEASHFLGDVFGGALQAAFCTGTLMVPCM